MTRRIPAEVFPPGEFIREELKARNWTQTDLAVILKRPLPAVNEIINGKMAITPDTAKALGDAFGTGPELWMNLESAYRLSLAEPSDEDVGRRAAIYSAAPVNEMAKRGWIKWSQDIEDLEDEVRKFFRVDSLDKIAPLNSIAARKSSSYDSLTGLENAWCHRARQLAESVDAKPFSVQKARDALANLHALTSSEQEARRVPALLAGIGVRLVVVERLPKTLIDGVAFWLDPRRPVIALSFRYERIDHFWFTLAHELAHILLGHKSPIDINLVGQNCQPTLEKSEIEQEADRFASEFLVPPNEINAFIVRVKPLYSKIRINQFAGRLGIHPGIIVGQLQYRREIGYNHSQEMLVKVRELVTASAMTDGWGSNPI
jgi:HTH-type transcriptional regulator/antitoxin HigA